MNAYQLLTKQAASPTGLTIQPLSNTGGALAGGTVGGVIGGLGGVAMGGAQALFDGEDDGITSTLRKLLGGGLKGGLGGAAVGAGAGALNASVQRGNRVDRAVEKMPGLDSEKERAVLDAALRRYTLPLDPLIAKMQGENVSGADMQRATSKANIREAILHSMAEPAARLTHKSAAAQMEKVALAGSILRGVRGLARAPGDVFHGALGFMNGGGRGFQNAVTQRSWGLHGLGRAGQVGNMVGLAGLTAGLVATPHLARQGSANRALGGAVHPDWQGQRDAQGTPRSPGYRAVRGGDFLTPAQRSVVGGVSYNPLVDAAVPASSNLPSGFQSNKLLQTLRGY